jgi:hypothetical protein
MINFDTGYAASDDKGIIITSNREFEYVWDNKKYCYDLPSNLLRHRINDSHNCERSIMYNSIWTPVTNMFWRLCMRETFNIYEYEIDLAILSTLYPFMKPISYLLVKILHALISKKSKKIKIALSDKLSKLLIKTGDDMNNVIPSQYFFEIMTLPSYVSNFIIGTNKKDVDIYY